MMTDFLEKINQLDNEIDNQQVHQQTKEVNAIVQTLKRHEVLAKAPGPLGFYPDEVEDLANQVGAEKAKALKIINQLFNSLRQFLSIKFGLWSVPNLATAQLIMDQLNVQSSLEIMAGNAYWTKALKQVGVAAIASDSLEWAKSSKTGSQPVEPIVNKSASAAIAQFPTVDLIICSWAPNFDQSDINAVSAWKQYNPNSHLLFVGEKNGVTNSPKFWHQVKFCYSPALKQINQSFTSFDFIDEQIFEIKHEI